jgi:hypothetical protein
LVHKYIVLLKNILNNIYSQDHSFCIEKKDLLELHNMKDRP